MIGFDVKPVPSQETWEWLLNKHYAQRIPSISYAFGLFLDNVLQGVVTYGVPSSATLRGGVAGEDNSSFVLELNRLCINDGIKNGASLLVSRSLKMLPKPSIVISFADTSQGHVGYIYQACNFTYHGLSAKRTDWKVKGKEHLHGQTIADEFRGVENRADAMREKYGDDFYLEPRARKHRYIYVIGSKKEVKHLRSEIRYPQRPYPKGKTERYDASYQPATQGVLF